MASLLDKVKAAVGNGTLMPDNYDAAIFASRNDPEVREYLTSITQAPTLAPAPTSPVALFQGRAPAMVGQGIQSTVEPAGSPIFNLPEGLFKVDDRGLPSDPLNRSNPFKNDPIIQGISGAIDTLNANQAEGFKDWLKTPAGRSYTLANAQKELRREIPSTPLGKSLEDPAELSKLTAAQQVLSTAQQAVATEAATPKPPAIKEDLTEEAKAFNTGATVVSPSAPEEKQDWFNAVNDRIDLMAMGAAMLAGSGQRGATTMSRLGEGLQAGLASRAAQAKEAENKQYKDALLLLEAQKARAAGITDPFKNYGAKINDISSFLSGSGFEGDNLTELSRLVHGLDTNFVSYPAATKKLIADEMAKEGSNWFSSGGELSTTDVEKTYLDAKKAIAQRLSK